MLPEAFLLRMEKQLGEEYEDFLKSLERPRAVALRFNPLKGTPPEMDFVEENAFQAVVSAHVDGGVPVIVMDCGELNDRKFGELVYFMELACGISAYLLGVNPFVQTGVEIWQQNLLQLLGKPISEKLL